MSSPNLRNLPYPQVKALIMTGSEGYYIERNGYVEILLPQSGACCEFPTAAEFDTLSGGFQQFFDRGWEADFRQQLAPKLVRSEALSDPTA